MTSPDTHSPLPGHPVDFDVLLPCPFPTMCTAIVSYPVTMTNTRRIGNHNTMKI